MRLTPFFVASAAAGALVVAAIAEDAKSYPAMGTVVRKDARFDKLIPPGAKIERLTGPIAKWAEGPVWVPAGKYLLFSDIPNNRIIKWQEGQEPVDYLKPSGYSGSVPFTGREPGCNGLMLDTEGRLLLCQHGDRCVARQEKDGKLTVLAARYEGRRFNSPNDLCMNAKGDIYFTDPPYGLPGQEKDPAKELPYQGVFRLTPAGEVTLLTKDMTRPNGIAFSPDEKTLYVANSDPDKAVWMAFAMNPDGTLGDGRVFFDATEWVKARKPGLPDGLKVDKDGNVFATGPGGVTVFGTDGKHLGTLDTGVPTANVGWGDDGSVLYITANQHLCRVKTTTKGR